jgi:3-dehydroquinate dehydratase
MSTLKYYFDKKTKIELVIFNKYLFDNGIIVNKVTRNSVRYTKNKAGYNKCTVFEDDGKPRTILIGRAIASTFYGPPSTPQHTADHRDKNRENDTVDNIHWLCKTGQRINQVRPETHKSAFIIIKDGIEKTAQEWVEYFKDDINHLKRVYTKSMIAHYAQRKHNGFTYKEYPDLPGEMWKKITDSENSKGRWEISNMCRVKYITNYAENVFSGERLGLNKGYPIVSFNGKTRYCHILAFMTFFSEEYASKKSDGIILHEDDDKLDFRPHKLRFGTSSENITDSYNNGKRNDSQTSRNICESWINGGWEKTYESQEAAVRYLKSQGYEKADNGAIYRALKAYKDGKVIVRYDRTWKLTE